MAQDDLNSPVVRWMAFATMLNKMSSAETTESNQVIFYIFATTARQFATCAT